LARFFSCYPGRLGSGPEEGGKVAGYEKGFLGPSVEAFGFLVCKKGRSYMSTSNRRANIVLIVELNFYTLFFNVLR
jgi:hypothetical protein